MEGQILAIHGYFGAHKTLTSVSEILKDLQKGDIIFTNIKFNINYINPKFRHNLYYFDNIDVLHDILAFSGFFAQKVSEYNEKAILNNSSLYPRYNRPKVKVYFDEMGIFANSADYAEFHKRTGKDLTQYILQIRKLFVDVIFIIQKPQRLVKELRQYVNYWLKPEPMFPEGEKKLFLGSLKNMKKIHWEIRDEDGELEFEKKVMLNTQTGVYENYEIPLRGHYKYILRVPYYFPFYDDLFLNLALGLNFKTDYLIKSNFIKNVYLGKVNNIHLKSNKKIYDEIALSSYTSTELAQIDNLNNKRFSFLDNPFGYFVHLIYSLREIKTIAFISKWFFPFLIFLFFVFFVYFILNMKI